jgi:hypothetical protein
MTRTLCKLVLAGALLVAAAFLPASVQAASTCCQNCLSRYNTCYNGCGSNDFTCQDNCYDTYYGCAVGCTRYGQSCPV